MQPQHLGAKQFASLGLLLALATGCGKKEPAASPEPAVPAAASQPLLTPTDEECRQLARKIEQAVKARDVPAASGSIDWSALLDRVFDRLAPSPRLRRDFETAFKQGVLDGGGPMREVVDAVAGGASYRFLRVRAVGQQRRALFRLILAEQEGVDYHEFLLAKREGGAALAVDFEVYSVGEPYSQILRRTAIPLVAEEQRTLLTRLARAERDFFKYSIEFTKLSDLMREERHDEALKVYDTLPGSLQKEKIVLLLRLRAAQQVSRPAFEAALREAREQVANDAAVNLLLIDNFVMRREYDKLRATLDRLGEALGGDPYLDVLRANSLIDEDRFADARSSLERAVKEEADLQPAKDSLRLLDATERPDFDDPLPEQKEWKALCVLARDGRERWVKMPGHFDLGSASVSPDGQWIALDALTSGLNVRRESWLVKCDGSGLRKLAAGATPRWAPDGRTLLLMRDDRAEGSWVFQIDRDGRNERKICAGRWPDYAPDGKLIALSRGGSVGRLSGAFVGAKVYTVKLDGSDPQYVADGDCPSFSPDGAKIAYCQDRPEWAAPKLLVIDLKTKARQELRFGWYRAHWSGDGKKLVANGMGPDDRYTPVRLTLGQADVDYFLLGYRNPFSPTVSRDGNLTVFLADRPGRESPGKEKPAAGAKE